MPCSKELYPLGFAEMGEGDGQRPHPKVVSQYLLEAMRRASVSRCFFLLRPGKWDIPAYYRDGHGVGIDLGYLVVRVPYGVPYTLDQAYPFVRDATVAMGFPDILFEPTDAFARLLTRQTTTGADVVLGLFPTAHPERWDAVELDRHDRVVRLEIKQEHSSLRYAWAIAVWSPNFTQFVHDFLKARPTPVVTPGSASELHVGDLVRAAVEGRLQVEGERFDEGWCLDIGTPDDLARALRWAMDRR